MQIGFIGAGNMAQAIIKGLISNNVVDNDDIIVNANTIDSLSNIKTKYEVNVTTQKKEVLRFSDVIILAVKPNQIDEVIQDIKQDMNLIDSNTIFISIAAGITIERLEKAFYYNNVSGQDKILTENYEDDYQFKIVRTMPNMPASVGAGMTGVAINRYVKFSDIDKVLSIFSAIGKVEIIEEKLMDAVVALSGSSPAYMYLIIEAMAKAAESEGMKKEVAMKFAAQAMIGSGKVILEQKVDPSQLIKEVCSPGGTTIEAMKILEKNDVEGIFIEAMEACINRSKEL